MKMTAGDVIGSRLANSWIVGDAIGIDDCYDEADIILSRLKEYGFRVVSSYEWDLREIEIKCETEAACIEAVKRLRNS